MKTLWHKDLFEQFKNGKLNADEITILHESAVGAYFDDPSQLDAEAMDYAEDLVIEYYALHSLDKEYSAKFREMLASNPELRRKYHLLQGLHEAQHRESEAVKRMFQAENPELQKQEEAQLEVILKEALQKVHTEEEMKEGAPVSGEVADKLKVIFANLSRSVVQMQPQVRYILVAASLVVVIGMLWLIRPPRTGTQIAHQTTIDTLDTRKDTLKNEILPQNFIQDPDRNLASADSLKKSSMHDINLAQDNQVHKPDSAAVINEDELLAYAEGVPSEMDYMLMRSEGSLAGNLFIEAAKNYNNKDYEVCISKLSTLISSHLVHDADTLNTIHYYLGLSYFAKGFRLNNTGILKHALASLKSVTPVSPNYNDARWFEALVYARLSKKATAVKTLDSLLADGYERLGEVRKLKDRLKGNTTE